MGLNKAQKNLIKVWHATEQKTNDQYDVLIAFLQKNSKSSKLSFMQEYFGRDILDNMKINSYVLDKYIILAGKKGKVSEWREKLATRYTKNTYLTGWIQMEDYENKWQTAKNKRKENWQAKVVKQMKLIESNEGKIHNWSEKKVDNYFLKVLKLYFEGRREIGEGITGWFINNILSEMFQRDYPFTKPRFKIDLIMQRNGTKEVGSLKEDPDKKITYQQVFNWLVAVYDAPGNWKKVQTAMKAGQIKLTKPKLKF